MIEIRKATIEDASRISKLIRKSAEKVKENNHSPEQVRVWKEDNTVKAIKNKFKQRTMFCAFESGKLVGTIGLEGDYLVGLYISYSKRGTGLGHQLLTFLENYALKKNVNELQLTATPNGYGFYLKYGYEPQGKIDLYYDGIKFIETKMKKRLK